jgi:hypothetical protein
MKQLISMFLFGGLLSGLNAADWQQLRPETLPTKRHEAAFAELDGKFYLLGGRGIKSVEVYDPETNRWEKKAKTPIELHHFQALNYGGKLYVIWAFTGPYPNETPFPPFIYTIPRLTSGASGPRFLQDAGEVQQVW